MTRWLVDAMNVIGSRPDKWWNDPKKAMREFAVTLDDFATRTGDEVTVVFDTDPGPLEGIHTIEPVIARRRGRNAADHEIEQIVAADDEPGSLRVVTSDRRLVEKVTELGAKVTSSGRFRNQLDA
ncbi:MAG: NYN domain-containing protein [Actinobacteria bacterium]|nr:NYN domain-containing protein [Actinomycetota bacterium]